MELRADEWRGKTIPTIYLGGGTPSLLSLHQLETLLEPLRKNAFIPDSCEITLEANPEDVNPHKASEWRASGINRVSLGLQSLNNDVLRWMNRGHTGDEGLAALEILQEAGFNNLNVDIIYGIPGLTALSVIKDIENVLAYNPAHFSCYELTCEPGTAYAHQVKKGRLKPAREEDVCEQFTAISELLESYGYLHYEVSNYALPGREACHNRRYWYGLPTLGFGPSAVSFDGKVRRTNLANNALYMLAVEENHVPLSAEILSEKELYNEFVLTRLRLKEGIYFEEVSEKFGKDKERLICKKAQSWPDAWKELTGDYLRLSRQGRLLADNLAMELFDV